jgi:hypothetical protein
VPSTNNKGWEIPGLVAMSVEILQKKLSSCYLYIVMSAEVLKKKRSKDPICSYLRKLISPYGFGWEENIDKTMIATT